MALRAIHTAILGSFQPGGSAATDWQAANCPGTKSFPIRPKDSFKFRMQYNFIRQEPGAKTMTSTSYRLWWYVGTFHGAVSTPARLSISRTPNIYLHLQYGKISAYHVNRPVTRNCFTWAPKVCRIYISFSAASPLSFPLFNSGFWPFWGPLANVSFWPQKAQLLAGITLQPVINFWGWLTFKSRRKRIWIYFVCRAFCFAYSGI